MQGLNCEREAIINWMMSTKELKRGKFSSERRYEIYIDIYIDKIHEEE